MTDQLKQEILHETVLPKYSALSDAKPNRLHLVGVWIVFFPMTVGSLGFAFSHWWNGPNIFLSAIGFIMYLAFSLLCGAVLYKQTKRCLDGAAK